MVSTYTLSMSLQFFLVVHAFLVIQANYRKGGSPQDLA